jgi:hypothetical protein
VVPVVATAVQYVFWITLPAADVPALAAVIPAASGPPGPPNARVVTSAAAISRRQHGRPHLGPQRLHDTVHRPGAGSLSARQESSSPASAHAGRVWLKGGGRHHSLSRWPDWPTQTQEDLPARSSPWLQRVKRKPSVSCPAGHAMPVGCSPVLRMPCRHTLGHTAEVHSRSRRRLASRLT